jgi:hypothetical protein
LFQPLLAQALTKEGGEVDLLIRTGGEKHPVSNKGSSSLATAVLESTGAGVSDNRHPAPGEATFYQGERDGASHNTYARIACVPNLDHTGHRGWLFRIFTDHEIRTPYLRNIAFLQCARNIDADETFRSRIVSLDEDAQRE